MRPFFIFQTTNLPDRPGQREPRGACSGPKQRSGFFMGAGGAGR
jgi:hypothetical protein